MYRNGGQKLVCEANIKWKWNGVRHYGRVSAVLPEGKIIVLSGVRAFMIDTNVVRVRRLANYNSPKEEE